MAHTDSTTNLVWFRDDLRASDNPALSAACARGGPVIACFVREQFTKIREHGAASRWWLHHSLRALDTTLQERGGRLILRSGDPRKIIPEMVTETDAKAVHWNRRYDPKQVEMDKSIKAGLQAQGIEAISHKANLLFEPWELQTGSGQSYKVFTPFWRAARQAGLPDRPLPLPRRIQSLQNLPPSDCLDDWQLLPSSPNWARGFAPIWQPGETGAHQQLQTFLQSGIARYADGRDIPGKSYTSRLSPHLAFGEISPRQIVSAVRKTFPEAPDRNAEKFLSEVGWREFAKSISYHAEDLANINWRPEYDDFPWVRDDAALARWQQGHTGIALVDAGMRELWETGYMHNRVRMVVASFLIKNLLIDWRKGEQWFWDTLLDADVANNPFGWQWVAGSGADAAPFFRIFNPVTQGGKFDPHGDYIRKWVPERANLSAGDVHKPGACGTEPLVNMKTSRERALTALQSIKKN